MPLRLSQAEYARLAKTGTYRPKRHKFGAKAVTVGGTRFQSTKESKRALELEWRQAAGEISDLRKQSRFVLIVNGVLVCEYWADFTYRLDGALVVEDTKSEETRKLRAYRIKIKLMKAVFGITVEES